MAQSLYRQASLIMKPYGAKDDLLPSIKPTDGSGDFTFSRGTDTATRVNASGLIEKERSNQLLNSIWDGVGTNVPPTSWTNGFTSGNYESASSSFAGNTAIRFYGTAQRRYIFQSPTFGGIMALSVYVESVTTADEIRYLLNQIGGTELFYLEDSSVVANTTSISAGKTYTLVFNTSGTTEIRIGGGVTGNRTYDFTLSVPQLEQGLVRTSYIETTTAAAVYEGITDNLPRLDYSGGASCPSLLLEPSRTNLFAYSEYLEGFTKSGSPAPTLTANYAESPEGVNNAYRVEIPSVSGLSLFAQLVAHTSGTDMTISAYVKSNVVSDQSFKLFGDYGTGSGTSGTLTATSEWQRFTFTFTPTATGNRNAGILNVSNTASDLLVYGMQIEAGSYPTSYIPTMGTSASRAGEGGQVTSVSDLIGQTEGTLFAEVDSFGVGEVANRIFGISNGTSAERIIMLTRSTGYRFIMSNGAVNNPDYTEYTSTDGVHKLAMTYDANEVRIFVDGVKVHTDSSVTLPSSLNSVHIGKAEQNGNYGNNFGGSAKQGLVFKTALTDAECIALTTL